MNDDLLRQCDQASNLDPRRAPYGFFSGGSCALVPVRVFCWFDSRDALADFLLDVEPALFDLEGDDLKAYRASVTPILKRLKSEDFSASLLAAFNTAVKETLVVDWWGEFDDLIAGKTELSQLLISRFVGADDERERSPPLHPDQLDGFVEYLKTCSN